MIWPSAAQIYAFFWPIVVLAGLYLFRKPLSRAISSWSERAQKVRFLSVFSLDLSRSLLSDKTILNEEIENLKRGQDLWSGDIGFYNAIENMDAGDFVVVDMGSAEAPRWTSSRLYLYSFLLHLAHVRTMVFVHDNVGFESTLIGISSPAEVRRALGNRYSYLDVAMQKSIYQTVVDFKRLPNIRLFGDEKSSTDAMVVVNSYLQYLRVPDATTQTDQTTWLTLNEYERRDAKADDQIQFPAFTEVGRWMTTDRLHRVLSVNLDTTRISRGVGIADSAIAVQIARSDRDTIALVDESGRFLSLVDRNRQVDKTISNILRQLDELRN